MNVIFITSTDTNAGKTIVTGLLAKFLLDVRYKVITQKWIQTGAQLSPTDLDYHLDFMQKSKQDFTPYLDYMNPYNLKLAASPHLASETENERICTTKIKESVKTLSEKFDFVLAEGIGGALVPFTRSDLVIDIAKDLDLSVLIVACNKLGAINHTLLTIEALKTRNIKIIGIIFNNIETTDQESILMDNPKIVEQISGEKILGILSYSKDSTELHKNFIPIGQNILTALRSHTIRARI